MQLKLIILAILPFALAAPMATNGMASAYHLNNLVNSGAVDARAAAADANAIPNEAAENVDTFVVRYNTDVIKERN